MSSLILVLVAILAAVYIGCVVLGLSCGDNLPDAMKGGAWETWRVVRKVSRKVSAFLKARCKYIGSAIGGIGTPSPLSSHDQWELEQYARDQQTRLKEYRLNESGFDTVSNVRVDPSVDNDLHMPNACVEATMKAFGKVLQVKVYFDKRNIILTSFGRDELKNLSWDEFYVQANRYLKYKGDESELSARSGERYKGALEVVLHRECPYLREPIPFADYKIDECQEYGLIVSAEKKRLELNEVLEDNFRTERFRFASGYIDPTDENRYRKPHVMLRMRLSVWGRAEDMSVAIPESGFAWGTFGRDEIKPRDWPELVCEFRRYLELAKGEGEEHRAREKEEKEAEAEEAKRRAEQEATKAAEGVRQGEPSRCAEPEDSPVPEQRSKKEAKTGLCQVGFLENFDSHLRELATKAGIPWIDVGSLDRRVKMQIEDGDTYYDANYVQCAETDAVYQIFETGLEDPNDGEEILARFRRNTKGRGWIGVDFFMKRELKNRSGREVKVNGRFAKFDELNSLVAKAMGDDVDVPLAELGNRLKKLKKDFDYQLWGYDKLLPLLQAGASRTISIYRDEFTSLPIAHKMIGESVSVNERASGAYQERLRRRHSPKYDLERFAEFPDDWLKQLSDFSVPERWTIRGGKKYSVLWNYVALTFARLWRQNKVLIDDQVGLAVFNCGLSSRDGYDDVCVVFEKRDGGRRLAWRFAGVCVPGRERLGKKVLRCLPRAANLPRAEWLSTTSPERAFDAKIEIKPNWDHFIEDNLPRLPFDLVKRCVAGDAEMQEIVEQISKVRWGRKETDEQLYAPLRSLLTERQKSRMRDLLEGALRKTRNMVRSNPAVAVPHYYPRGDSFGFLLPLDLEGSPGADVALVVERLNGGNGVCVYQGQTILTMSMAYPDARLLQTPEVAWLRDFIAQEGVDEM